MAVDTRLNPLVAGPNSWVQDFKMPSGVDRTLVIPVSEPLLDEHGEPVLDPSGEVVMTPVDLTGAALTWQLKERSKDKDADPPALITKTLVNGGIEIDEGDNSICLVHINSEDTETLAGKYVHGLEVVDSTGHLDEAVHGTATIFKDVVV